MGRWRRGLDVRQHGSGNLGATNVYRVLGPRWGLFVLVVDALKGAGAVALARAIVSSGASFDVVGERVAGQEIVGQGTAADAMAAEAIGGGGFELAGSADLLGLAGSVLGHMVSPWASFRGGKGVATAAGAWAALAPIPCGIALLVWTLCFAATRIVSLASLVAALALPVAMAFWLPGRVAQDARFWAAVLTALFLIWRHQANLGRLIRRQEPRLELSSRRHSSRGHSRHSSRGHSQ